MQSCFRLLTSAVVDAAMETRGEIQTTFKLLGAKAMWTESQK